MIEVGGRCKTERPNATSQVARSESPSATLASHGSPSLRVSILAKGGLVVAALQGLIVLAFRFQLEGLTRFDDPNP